MDLFKRKLKSFSWQLTALSVFLLLVPLVMNNCSTSKYDKPPTTQTEALISPETLNAWIDSGVVNGGTGFDRVVILDVTSYFTYTTGHIPGAHYVDSSSINQTRMEGPATDINMALSGPDMDALIQKYGIDKNTTIVFTTGGVMGSSPSILNATRAYWTFRYWGFPKERLKLLDGVNFAWDAVYDLTTDLTPAPAPSTYSVKNNAHFRSDLRTSLSEMIKVAEANNVDPNAVPVVDMRSSATDGSYAGKRGSTSGAFGPSGDWVVFEGRVKGSKALLYTDLMTNVTKTVTAATDLRFKSKEALASMFNAVGVDGTKLAHVY